MANCFCPIPEKDRPVVDKPREFETIREIWNLVPKGTKIIDVDGVEQDVIEYVPVKVRDVNIAEYIASFSDEVGIQNILRKVALTGDKSYLNQTGRHALPTGEDGLEPIQDYSNVPLSKTEAFNAVAAGVRAYDALPAEIKEKMSFAQFAESFGQEQFDAYIEKLKTQITPKEDNK